MIFGRRADPPIAYLPKAVTKVISFFFLLCQQQSHTLQFSAAFRSTFWIKYEENEHKQSITKKINTDEGTKLHFSSRYRSLKSTSPFVPYSERRLVAHLASISSV
jgi:hypothetical protein